MNRAEVLHGIASCVALLYVRNIEELFEIQAARYFSVTRYLSFCFKKILHQFSAFIFQNAFYQFSLWMKRPVVFCNTLVTILRI